LLGVAFADFLRGVQMNAAHDVTGGFFDLLSPYALLGWLTTLTLFALHGACFLVLRTEGDVALRAQRLTRVLAPLAGLLALAFVTWTSQVRGGAVSLLLAAALVLALLAAAVRGEHPARAFACTSTAAALLPVGGGKSTLLAVLLRLVDVQAGSVLVGDTDLRELDPVSWRRRTAWAPQRPRSTQPTVADEVLLGDPGATGPQLQAALTDCSALPPETRLGEDGTHISTGQRRRVALARALLRARAVQAAGGVPLVLLDEPSEDLDLDTERVVAAVISGLAGWATVLVATHGPRLARLGDRRVELRDGRVVSDVSQRRELCRPGPARAVEPRPRPAAPTAPERPSLRDLASVLGADRPRGTGRRLVGAGLLAGGAGLSGLALLTTSVWLICRAAQHPEVQALALAVVGVRGFALSRALLRYLERLVSHDAALHLLADVRTRVFAALHPLAPAGLADLRRGDLLRRFVSDVDGAQDALVRTVVPLTGAVLTALGAVAVAALLSPSSGVVLAAGLLVGLVGVPLLSQRLARGAARRAEAAGVRDTRTSALIDGLAELTAYGADLAAVDEVALADAALVDLDRRPARAAAAGAALSGLVTAVTLVLVLSTAAATAAGGAVAPVTVAVLVACVLAGFDALVALPAALAAWAGARAGLDRVVGLLSTPPPVPEPELPMHAPDGRLGVEVATVTLAPSATAPAVLTAASLSLLPGQYIALMGPSGAGRAPCSPPCCACCPYGPAPSRSWQGVTRCLSARSPLQTSRRSCPAPCRATTSSTRRCATTCASYGPPRVTTNWTRRQRGPGCWASCASSRTAGRPRPAPTGRPCRAASASGCCSPAPCSPTRSCWSWTSRRPTSTRRPSGPCWPTCLPGPGGEPS